MKTSYDAIIVGARCGGAPLAMLLARAGHKVLLVDRMAFGSDIMSTHFLKRRGASQLHKWGLLENLKASGVAEIKQVHFHVDGTDLDGTAPPINGVPYDITPRRYILDKILVDAAIEAGVEVRDRFSVKELIFDEGRVVGIVGSDSGGSEVRERAKVVVGADGINSMVANAVGAEFRLDRGIHNCAYYAYFSGMREEQSRVSMRVLTDKRRFYITFPTHEGLDVVFLFWSSDQAAGVRKNVELAFHDSLLLMPDLKDRVDGAKRETRFAGSPFLPNFYRHAHGPGWALVGDAAIHRDPITAQGITNAFTQADVLAEELDQAFQGNQSVDEALAKYDQRQFELLKPMFDHTVYVSKYPPLAPALKEVLPSVVGNSDATTAFIGAFMDNSPIDKVLMFLKATS